MMQPPDNALSSPGDYPAQKPNRRLPRNDLVFDLAIDLVLIAGLIVLTIALEHSRFGNALMLAAYEWQQQSLATKPHEIAILDISELNPSRFDNGLATPRKSLVELLQAVADDQPAAIGIDINFAPDEKGNYITKEDPQFFEACSALKSDQGKPIPVFVGVSAGERHPEKLLTNPQVSGLVATIDLCEDTRRLPLWIEYGATQSHSMCAALAGKLKTIAPPRRWLRWIAEGEFGPTCGNEPAAEFIVDYSPLDLLESRDYTIRIVNPATIRETNKTEHLFRGKVVLFGDAQLNTAVDTFNVLTRIGRAPVPGVYIHACGVTTLLNGRIYELTLFGRILVDATLSLITLIPVTLVRLYFRDDEKVAIDRLKILGCYIVALGAVYVAGKIAASMHLLWVDYYIVLLVLIAHPCILAQVRNAYTLAKEIGAVVVRRILFVASGTNQGQR